VAAIFPIPPKKFENSMYSENKQHKAYRAVAKFRENDKILITFVTSFAITFGKKVT